MAMNERDVARLWGVAAEYGFAVTRDKFVDAATRGELCADADIEEFCLALACNESDPRALRLFDDNYMAVGAAFLRSQGFAAHTVDDSVQRVRSELLMTRPGARYIRLVDYAGSGRLRSLVRVSCSRYARYLATYVERGSSTVTGRVSADEAGDYISELWSNDDPEVNVLRSDLHGHFKLCFQQALGELGDEDRTLLRLYYVQGMALSSLGRLFDLNKSSISRRLSQVRTRLLKTMLRKWGDAHRGDVNDISMLLDGALDFSMSRILRASTNF